MMKKLIDIAIILLVFSCTTKEKPSTSNEVKLADTIVPFSGYWLDESYFNSIRELKSPKKAQYGSEFIFIPDTLLKPTLMVYNFHMGGDVLEVVRKSSKYYLHEIHNENVNKSLTEIQIISPTNIKIGEIGFIKINPVKQGNEELVLEEILFKGHYITNDNKVVEFKNNRQLSGLDSFSYYYPIIDFTDNCMNVDKIGLGKTEKKLDWYGFKFKKDTLELYKLNCIVFDSARNECISVDYGKLEYKLLRKK